MECKHCREKIKHIRDNLWHGKSSVFPQYCKNTVDKNGNIIKYGGLHEPTVEKSSVIDAYPMGSGYYGQY